jgi:protein-tyrosine phosphatase
MSSATHYTTEILPGLYMSGMPEPTWPLEQWGIGLVVSLSEHTPPQAARRFEWGTRGDAKGEGHIVYLHWPIVDGDAPDMAAAAYVAFCAAHAVAVGTNVLVHCQEGRNRSGLIVALAVRQLKGLSGADAIEHVRSLRPIALSNESFVAALELLPVPLDPTPRRAVS